MEKFAVRKPERAGFVVRHRTSSPLLPSGEHALLLESHVFERALEAADKKFEQVVNDMRGHDRVRAEPKSAG